MLTAYPKNRAAPQKWQRESTTGDEAIWLDLLNPSDDERRHAEAVLGAPLPTRDQVSSIALSDRLRADPEVLRLNIPSFVRAEGGQGALTPLGFVLTPSLLLSLRYADSLSFDRVNDLVARGDGPASSVEAFVHLIETIVGVAADRMEVLSNELSQLSRAIFSDRRDHANQLRGALFQVGKMQRQVTQIRAAMLGVQRIASFVHASPPDWMASAQVAPLEIVLSDLQALSEFDQQLSDKVQFVLDAVLGFINNDQNDTMKVLTIVSVVTIPPMILAGIWGMNFKSIPEYNWAHGYAFGLSMIVLSMVLPLIWFKWKKWL